MPPQTHRESEPTHPGGGSEYDTPYHKPVLCKTVVDALITSRTGTYVDATLGGGGHTAALLDALAPEGGVIGFDRDTEALSEAEARMHSAVKAGRLRLVHRSFGEMGAALDELEIPSVHGILLDLGVSSHQLDEGSRGFSFRFDGPLDMRMNAELGDSAAEWVNLREPAALREILYTFGEVSAARRITDAICRARPIETTGQLAAAVKSVVPSREAAKILAKVFQALRIAVNDELEELEAVLRGAAQRVRLGGRVAVISYHSLEDRRVKRYLRFGNFEGKAERDLHGNLITPWHPLWRKALQPDAAEIDRNPRARSARLRVAERVQETPETKH